MSLAAALALISTISSLGQLEPIGDDAAQITIEPTEVRYIETRWSETVIRSRPWVPRGRLATLSKGTRLVVRGTVPSRDKAGCEGKIWYAVQPYGFVCSRHVKPSQQPPTTGRALELRGDRTLPYDYLLVRNDDVPMYRNEDEILNGTPQRLLSKGMSLAAGNTREVAGVPYLETADGMLVPKDELGWMGRGSQWSGVALRGETQPGPVFGWIGRDKTPVYATPAKKDATAIEYLPYRRRVALTGPELTNEEGRWWPIGDQRWVEASRLNAVVIIDPPAGVIRPEQRARGNNQWIDVDVGEQVLVAYRGETPVFATMISSGRASPTPRGNYPIWAKVASMTMDNQGYEDKAYMVEHVPWVL
ncbi:MAG TPA: murein L,D-transpeptidase, partial [Nannocystis exedens]|nr:murein L,D-transpeptidase [Nannocystis exedens]